MEINLREALRKKQDLDLPPGAADRLPDLRLDPGKIRAVLINEVVPEDPSDDFYAGEGAAYPASALPLFRDAGFLADTTADLLRWGIYLTNAVKAPKSGYDIPTDTIKAHLPLLLAELALFGNLQAILLMGDVAKKALNLAARKGGGKPVIPGGSTYKLRKEAYFWGSIRVFPSYIITGGNLRIEKSKSAMIREDLTILGQLLGQPPA